MCERHLILQLPPCAQTTRAKVLVLKAGFVGQTWSQETGLGPRSEDLPVPVGVTSWQPVCPLGGNFSELINLFVYF